MNMKHFNTNLKEILIVGRKDTLYFAIMRAINQSAKIKFVGESDFKKEILQQKPNKCLIIINTNSDTVTLINKWLWIKLRLNEKELGKELAGLPVIVLGMDKEFLDSPSGKVFKDFRAHHSYLTKPINLYQFILSLSNLSPIDLLSLSVINSDAPNSLCDSYWHDLRCISQKFNYSASDEEIKRRIRQIEVDFNNYEHLENNKKNIKAIGNEIEKLKTKVLNRRGNIWKK